MDATDLRQAYLEFMMEDPSAGLEAFLRLTVADAARRPARADLLAFLEGVESDIVSSIHTRAGANPGLASDVDDRVEEAVAEIARLAAKYAPAGATD